MQTRPIKPEDVSSSSETRSISTISSFGAVPFLSFHNIEYTVNVPFALRKLQGGPERKHILKGIDGVCRPSELTAILGPTGSGKSSLLDVLAGRKRKQNLGESSLVLIDGKPRSSAFLRKCGYCEQRDTLLGTLTVRETLLFSAELRLPENIGKEAKKKRVEDVIRELGLEKCADSFIGTELIRGISGGEMKRCSLGRELVNDPSLIFLDEPTTGLDAETAGNVVDFLSKLAHKGKTIILSIHQPKYSIFKKFQSVILLHHGSVAYQGPADHAIEYFQALGYHLEAFNNPADWFLEILVSSPLVASTSSAATSSDSLPSVGKVYGEDFDLGDERKSMSVVEMLEDGSTSALISKKQKTLAEIYEESNEFVELRVELESIQILGQMEMQKQRQLKLQGGRSRAPAASQSTSSTSTTSTTDLSPYATSLLTQIKILSRRTLLSSIRNPASAFMQFGAMFFFIALLGSIYWKMDLGPTGLQNRVGAAFLLIMMCMFSNISALELFIQERSIFLNEKTNGYYRTSAYFIARAGCDIIPLRVLPGIMFCSVVYFMMGLQSGVQHFVIFTSTVIMTMLTSAALCLLLSSLVPIFAVANLGVALIFILFMVTGGTLINFNQLPSWLVPLKNISIFRYAMETLTVNELTGLQFNCGDNTAACVSSGDAYLQLQKYPPMEDLWQNILIISSMFVVYMGLTYLVLRRLRLDS